MVGLRAQMQSTALPIEYALSIKPVASNLRNLLGKQEDEYHRKL